MAYIGNNLDSDIQVNKYEYTATAGQTTFACTYDRAVDVYVNGVKLDSSDFTATNGTAIVLASGANVGDIVDINAYFDVTYAGADAILPDQAGNSGKFLTTDGTNSSWGTVDLTNLNPNSLTLPNYSSVPSSPSAGDIYYNTTERAVFSYDGSNWWQLTNKFSAEGGNSIYTFGNYKVHVFTTSGTFVAQSSGIVDALIVAGGAGGGGWGGGGGAGGAVLATSQNVSIGSHSVIIGAGGAAGTVDYSNGGNGANSSFNGLTAIGGGGGGHFDGFVGFSGGSGGGGGISAGSGVASGGSGTSGQGNAGGTGGNQDNAGGEYEKGGGGGGAGAAGYTGNYDGSNMSALLGTGGIGIDYSSYFGTTVGESGYFAGGGGGHTDSRTVSWTDYTSNGGLGGGGAGGTYSAGKGVAADAVAGTANTGGGGGGAYGASSPDGSALCAAGGSGIVIIRYAI